MFSMPEKEYALTAGRSLSGGAILGALFILLIGFGVYPGPIIDIIGRAMLH
jgi:hypothetical protein